MRVLTVAKTVVDYPNLDQTGYVLHGEPYPHPIDELHEAAGRGCYESWNRPNPATATNKTYLRHIIEVDHLSVLGHGHVTLYVSGVSRALLLELERHQQRYSINFSVLSQRYVDQSNENFVVPPLLEKHLDERLHGGDHWNEWTVRDELEALKEQAQDCYSHLARFMESKGYSRKEIRGAARAVLPENTETRFFVTGSIRAWRNIIEQRLSDDADAEIREFARLVLIELAKVAPNSMQDLIEKHGIEENK